MKSRFGMFRRWRLEKQINYNNAKHPIFLYAYRAFIDALAKQDAPTLQKMCERSLYRKLDQNFRDIGRLNSEFFLVAQNIQLKMKLLDTRVIQGSVYIDRAKNLSAHYYEVI
jgi:hypothetical protein